jgi:hypothetical protein
MNILINAYEYGRFFVRQVRGEDTFQIYEEKRGIQSFTGIYGNSLEDAISKVCELIRMKEEVE